MSEPLLSLPEDRRVVRAGDLAREVLSRHGVHHVVGAEGVGPALAARALAVAGAHVVYVTTDSDMARRAAADLAFVAKAGPLGPGVSGNATPLSLMVSESSAYADVRTDRRTQMQRAGVLHHVAAGLDWRFLVVPAPALLRLTTPRAPLVENAFELVAESEIDVADVATRLAHAGYLRAPVVEDPGSFAVRGGILDVWAGNAEAPVRAELYGDLVVSLKIFDPEDQRTRQEVERVLLPPAREIVTSPKNQARARERIRELCDLVNHPSTKARALEEDVVTARSAFGLDAFLPAFYDLVPLWSLLPKDTVFVIEDPPAMVQAIREELGRAVVGETEHQNLPHFPLNLLYVGETDVASALAAHSTLAAHRSAVAATVTTDLEAIELAPVDAPSLAIRDSADLARAVKAARAERGKGAALDPLIARIASFHEAGLAVNITARTSTQSERLATLLGHRGVAVVTSDQPVPRETVRVLSGELVRGGVIPTEGLVLLTEEEIFGQRAHRRPERARSARAVLEDLRALEVGDHVVHVDHGVGRYLGLEKRSINGVGVELLVVEYGSGDKLFLPVYRLNQIQKYSGGEGAPKLDRLGGQSFAKTKARVQRRVRQMADELLRLYAERQDMKREPLEPADDDYAAFEATFPYEETRDQAAAISEVLRDLEKKSVMDRLVCGDVGFGKTEVALRAAFRIATSGRQVAILCPTTVLAQQHLLTFSSRLSGYPIVIKALSRFQSKTEQTETLKGLKEGKVDVVIGTHRLLSKDVHFARLGLLVVDEEQRFGVTHKERIKQIRASVDVLTLSATPIPRTLQLAVGGLRDMSLITTPPMDRRSIRTIVSRWDEHIIREAVERELSRGGQVFYVYNRVEGLYERAARLQKLVPHARVAVGHGQMSEASLEKTMMDFVDGKYDVLGSTAIIESGLDIPRANTMIIDRADLFGLSQLYQLRGRVGRSSERAYCYLIVPPPSELTDEARSRIEALERHTELGSGFQIATLDMEIRGAGDLLGGEQSGFVASVGFDLFCQMLEEAAHELKGEPVEHEVEPELSVDVDALLPEEYISEVGVRLSLYKRLASAHGDADVEDVAREMEDRFGPPPPDAKKLVELMRLKTELRRLRVLGCDATRKGVTLNLRDDTPLDPQKVGILVGRKKSPYRLTPDGRLGRRALDDETFKDGIQHADKMLDELSACLRDGAKG